MGKIFTGRVSYYSFLSVVALASSFMELITAIANSVSLLIPNWKYYYFIWNFRPHRGLPKWSFNWKSKNLIYSVNLWQSQFGIWLENRLLPCSNIPMKSRRNTIMLIPVALSMVLIVEARWFYLVCSHSNTNTQTYKLSGRLNKLLLLFHYIL